MDKVELIKKINDLVAISEMIGVEIGEDDYRPYGEASANRRIQKFTEQREKLEREIIDSLCQHKWKRYSKMVYDCEICKIRRFSKEDLCQIT